MAAAAVASRSTAQKAALALGAGLAAGFGAYYITQVRSKGAPAGSNLINMTMHAGPSPGFGKKILEPPTLRCLENQAASGQKPTTHLVLHCEPLL